MIVTSICVFGILFLLVGYLYALLEKGKDFKIALLNLKVIFLFLLLGIVCFMPMVDGVSAVRILYSYFDMPSFFAMVLILIACLKQVITKNCMIYKFVESFVQIRFDIYSAFILFVYGGIVYGSSLGILDFYIHSFDIYHTSPLYQALISFILLSLLYVSNRQVGILGLFALIVFYMFGGEDVSVLECFICPYLMVYCAYCIVYRIFCASLRLVENKI